MAHRWRKFPSHVFQAESQQLSTPLEEIIGQERKRALYRSIEKLPKDTREVILLYYFWSGELRKLQRIKNGATRKRRIVCIEEDNYLRRN